MKNSHETTEKQIEKGIPWLQLIQLYLGMYTTHLDVTHFIKILTISPHMNGCVFDCRTRMSPTQLGHVIDRFIAKFKEMTNGKADNKRNEDKYKRGNTIPYF